LTGRVIILGSPKFNRDNQQFPGAQDYGEVRNKFHISQPFCQKRGLPLVVLVQLTESKARDPIAQLLSEGVVYRQSLKVLEEKSQKFSPWRL